jgi:hypothetical protein
MKQLSQAELYFRFLLNLYAWKTLSHGGFMAKRSTRTKSRRTSTSHPSRQSVEDINDPREDQGAASSRRSPQPKDTENPPNENLNKDPDETYGDTEIPHRNRQTR